MENHHAIKFGKSSISMGRLYHGELLVITRPGTHLQWNTSIFRASPTPQNRNSSSEIPLPQIRILSFRCAILCTKSFWRSNCDPGCLKRSGRNDDGRMRWCHVDVTWCNRGMYRVSMIHDYTKLYTHANMSTLVYFSLLYIYIYIYTHVYTQNSVYNIWVSDMVK